MKKFLAVLSLTVFLTLTSFTLNQGFPCHPNGDQGPCTHPQHPAGDWSPCVHSCTNAFGYIVACHPNGDLSPCVHPRHAFDVYPCTHVCF